MDRWNGRGRRSLLGYGDWIGRGHGGARGTLGVAEFAVLARAIAVS